MGGMSTWEIGAMRPDLFAAIAPVAGHHQDQRRDAIASKLCNTPVLVVHSPIDETCPWNKEDKLWKLLMQYPFYNSNFDVIEAKQVDHCSMFEHAYCHTTYLFEWLLIFERDDC